MTRPSLCYLTVSYAADLERFALLRHSLRLFSPDIPHLVYVDSEDVPLFTRRFGDERGIDIRPTLEVLPPEVEASRRLWRSWRGRLLDRLCWRLHLHRSYSGWKLQQVVKLEAARRAPAEAIVFLDSDVFLCAPTNADVFFAEHCLLLHESAAVLYEDYAFETARQIMISGNLSCTSVAYKYIHQSPRFLRRTASDLIEHLGSVHPNWIEKFFDTPMASEYNLLGWAVRTLNRYEGYHRETLPAEGWAYEVKRPGDLAGMIATCRQEQGARRFFLVQSNMGLEAANYIPMVTQMLDELAAYRPF
jgi:hypothetical protein